MRSTILAAAVLGILATAAQAQTPTLPTPAASIPPAARQIDKGIALVDGRGMTLYTFARDAEGRSACVAACAVNWPPLMAPVDAVPQGDYGLAARSEGGRQWTYRGRPLYLWSGDRRVGESTGDGLLEGAWRVARP